MSGKNRLITNDEFQTAVKWAMVEVILLDDYKKDVFSTELEDLADSIDKAFNIKHGH